MDNRFSRPRICAFVAVAAAVVVCVDPSVAFGRRGALQTLAARYAPVVRLSEQEKPCAGGEAFEPIDVQAILGNDEVALRGPWKQPNIVKVAPTASDLSSDRHGYALDFPGNALSSSACSYEQWQRRITARRRPTVYAHVAVEDGDLALQYWFFYVYNDFNNKHEGDWEVIQLDFRASTPALALRTHPFEVGYSQHEGAERAEWDSKKLELVRTHPVVYPAEGSHANYYSAALFLGRSAAEGVGCDDTNEPWRQLDPAVDVIPASQPAVRTSYPWLGYQGHWGERRRGFYDAPTGPSTKAAWTEPITWANDSWRSKSFALAGGRSLGPTATKFFCRAVGAASTALIFIATRPSESLAVVAVLIAVLLWLVTRTRWDLVDPGDLRRRRPWGSLITAAGRTYAADLRLFLSLGAIFLVLGVVLGGVQYLVFRRSGLSSLVDAFGASNALTETVVLGLGFVVNLFGLAIVQATAARALVERTEHGRVSATDAYRWTLQRLGALLGGLVLAAFAVAVLDLTLVGLPIAIWLTVRWSLLAPNVALHKEGAVRSLRRSAELVRGNWWRTASFTVFVTGFALLLGPLAGTLLLFASSASFDAVNLVSDLVYVVALPFAAIATTYLYFDLVARSAERATATASKRDDAPSAWST